MRLVLSFILSRPPLRQSLRSLTFVVLPLFLPFSHNENTDKKCSSLMSRRRVSSIQIESNRIESVHPWRASGVLAGQTLLSGQVRKESDRRDSWCRYDHRLHRGGLLPLLLFPILKHKKKERKKERKEGRFTLLMISSCRLPLLLV